MFQRIWQYIQPASQLHTMCNRANPGPPHPAFSPPRSSDRPTVAAMIGLDDQIISAWTVWDWHREPCLHAGLDLTAVCAWHWLGKYSHLDGMWNFGTVFSSHINPGFFSTYGADGSRYGVVWMRVCRCNLLLAFWTRRDSVTRSRNPLLLHSSTSITSCCSMVVNGLHNARFYAQFLEAENIRVLAGPEVPTNTDLNRFLKLNLWVQLLKNGKQKHCICIFVQSNK